jgi:hypothetical protein
MNPIGYSQKRKGEFKVSNSKDILNKINNCILIKLGFDLVKKEDLEELEKNNK